MSKKNILSLIFSFSVVLSGYSQIISEGDPSESKVIDQIVAQVGDDPVLMSDIQAQLIQLKAEGEKVDENTACQLLEELLYQNLLLNQAKIDSIEITDPQVNGEMENRLRMLESQIGSREKLEQFYGKTYTQIKEEFREAIRERMMSQEMERQITQDIEVSPSEVKKFFKSIPTDSVPDINESISIQQIAIFPKITQESRNEVIDKLNRWRKEMIAGERNFSSTAIMNSEDLGSAKNGGKLDASIGMMVKPFEAAALALQPGEISEVVETTYGYHLIELISRKGDDYTVRHILLSPEFGRKELSEAAELMDECYSRLKKNEITWEQAVKEYSEDENTKQNNGTLSNPYTGDQYWDIANINEIDPQIYGLVNALDVGQISSPALYSDARERKEGVRIVRIESRTDPHKANLKDDYSFIMRAAKEHKKNNIIKDWVNANAKKTYIRIDDKYKNCDFHYNWK